MGKMIPLNDLQKPFKTKSHAIHSLCIKGISHELDNMPMQDSCAALQLGNGWIVLAVADGVGSEPRSDIGAQIAVTTVVNHINSYRGFYIDDKSIETMLYTAYQAACAEIYEQAMNDHASISEYSTTLDTVIFADGLLYIMHVGDGGIAVITEEGEYKKLTVPMKDIDGESVIPLQKGPEKWQFLVSTERAQSVIMVTDGVWDKLCPTILEGYGYKTGMEKSIATFFMSPWARDWEKDDLANVTEKELCVMRGDQKEAVPEFYNTLVKAIAQGEDISEAQELVKEKIAPGNFPLKFLRGITDDITVLTLVRYSSYPPKTQVGQFSPPDWAAINQWAHERLYMKSNSSPEAAGSMTEEGPQEEAEEASDD